MVADLQQHYGLILGGSSGLGYATAVKCAQHGMRLIIIYRASRMQMPEITTAFERLKNYHQHLFLNADAIHPTKVDNIIDQIEDYLNGDRIYLLLHSISKGNVKPMISDQGLSSADFEQTVFSMGISLYHWAKILVDKNMLSRPARILSFTSEGNNRPMPGYAAVSAAKNTLESITRSMAIEFAGLGITANCIQPGITDTASLRRIPQVELLIENALSRNPMKRLTTPVDVANVVYLMCRPESNFINGTIIKVDGGESLQ